MERKTRTCTRCNGTGLRSTSVAHMGIPGLCFGCNGSKLQAWYTGEELRAEKIQVIERHQAELCQMAAECKTILETGRSVRQLTAELEAYRETYRCNTQKIADIKAAAIRGEWRA